MYFRLACVASVSFWFRNKERPRKEIFGFDRARNETRANILEPFFARSLTLVPRSLLIDRTETLATQANFRLHSYSLVLDHNVYRLRKSNCCLIIILCCFSSRN